MEAMLSDEGDLYSDDEEQTGSYLKPGTGTESMRLDRPVPSVADRRAHHNALERKRRDHIKDSFSSLRDSVPSLQGEKASRAQILKKAAEYIQYMRKKNTNVQTDIEEIKKQNKMLADQIRLIEKQRTGNSSSSSTYSSVQTLLNSLESASNGDHASPSSNIQDDDDGEDDLSENSNESTNIEVAAVNGLNGCLGATIVSAGSIVNNMLKDSPSPSNVIDSSTLTPMIATVVQGRNSIATNASGSLIKPGPQLIAQQSQLLINGNASGTTPIRSAMIKNANVVSVQNPQVKSNSSVPHQIIHVNNPSSSNNTATNLNSGNISATATPIIISTTSLGNGPASIINGTGTIVSGANGNTFTIVNKGSNTASNVIASGSTHNISQYRTVVVQPSTGTHPQQSAQIVAGTTTTPNIHIVSAVSSNYPGCKPGQATKRFKISTGNIESSAITTVNAGEISGNINLSKNIKIVPSTTTIINTTSQGSSSSSNTTKSATAAQPTKYNIASVST
ncbi:hypothetical protein NH340_JMT02489 [Sarcoptes scabiei]|nr:hypothetical protein NH340_JMT02489 [Sarcoptes scabiei]